MTMPTPPPSPFPPLAEAIGCWSSADAAFARARGGRDRGVAMLQELRSRGAIYRLSEIECMIENQPTFRRRALRVELVREGVWSPDEAIERLVLLPFDER